ncbi:MAG: 8-oxoguanine DNA glycosylase [Lachnospiraceae bacterium]|nr:8-oxoguanine DNA glycosylase [Lachnospiraceae bacterium]
MKVVCSELNLKQIADSGQCFRMRALTEPDALGASVGDGASGTSVGDGASGSDAYEIISRDRRVIARQLPDGIELDCSPEEYEAVWRTYFDMDTDYASIIASVDPSDKYLTGVAQAGYGIRILNQDLWEMIVTFLISQQNNIPRIHKCIENICRTYGRHVETGAPSGVTVEGTPGLDTPDGEEPGRDFFAFPTSESLAALGEDDLMPCNLGYRSKYVVRAARSVVSGELDLDQLRRLDYPGSRERLLKVYGIGQKVADCVCLFALHHLEAFPIDTHIRQVLEREYGTEYSDAFPFSRYHDHLGVLQQYMFYGELMPSPPFARK